MFCLLGHDRRDLGGYNESSNTMGFVYGVVGNPRAWKPLCCVWQRDWETLTPARTYWWTRVAIVYSPRMSSCPPGMLLSKQVQLEAPELTHYSVIVNKGSFRIFNKPQRKKNVALFPSFLNILSEVAARHMWFILQVLLRANRRKSCNICRQLSSAQNLLALRRPTTASR